MTALLLAIEVLVASDHLVLGQNAELAVTLVLHEKEAPRVAASVGQIDPPRATGAGGFQTVFHAPRQRFPQVAVIAAWSSGGNAGMAVVPLYGTATLPIQVDAAHAAISLLIGNATFRGIADAAGRARVDFVAPPGAAMGTVQATDRLGNVKTRQVA